jgi:subtilisin family serine protease
MAYSKSSLRRRFTRAAGLAAAGLLVAGAHAGAASAADGQIRGQHAANAIADNYIVVLDQDKVAKGKAKSVIDSLAGEQQAKLTHRYLHSLEGFSAEMTEAQAKKLANDPAVAYVEQDQKVKPLGTQSAPPSWGLDRIDQRDLPLNNAYTYPNTAANVTAYIIDTGIRTTHSAFGGRASWGTNTSGDGNNTDCNGHGTHVAGTVGGAPYGVAKGVKLVAVKVLSCAGSGSLSGVMAGIDWVTAQHQAGQPAVANMSLGAAGTDAALENAVRNSIADGVVYAVASGNSNSDACNFTPARVPEAITVNATTNTDARASFSNFGACTDIFAPGQAITSAWNTNDGATNTISGTSMATPHVAGATALVLGAMPQATPQMVRDRLVADATTNKVSDPGAGSPNRLLFAAAADGPWSGTGTATTTVTSDGTTGNAVLDYSVNGYSGNWTFSNTAKSTRKQPITWRYKGYHAWFQVRVAIEQFVIRNGTEIVKQTLQSAGPVNCCAAPSGGFDYTGTATFDLQPGDVYGFRMSGSNFDSDHRLIGTLTLTS